jgi:hypothetical protein
LRGPRVVRQEWFDQDKSDFTVIFMASDVQERREWGSITAVTATSSDAYSCAIIPFVYAGYKHIRTQAEVSTVYAISSSSKKNGIPGISRQGLKIRPEIKILIDQEAVGKRRTRQQQGS